MILCISAICSRPKPFSDSPCRSLARVSGSLQSLKNSPEVLMGDPAEFQIEQYVAAQQAIVENQVHEEVLFVEGEALLEIGRAHV